jgi:multidrug efflux system membrane fusion protein
MTVKWIVGVVLLVAVCAGVWAFTRPKPTSPTDKAAADPAARVVPVAAAAVTTRDMPITLDGLGNVTAFNTVTMRSQIDGRLDKVLFREGDAVKAGQLLAQIDPRPYEVQLHQAEGALARDMATLRNDQLNLERNKELRVHNLVAQQTVDDQSALVGQAQGAVSIDKAAIESAKLNLEYTRITAPLDGVTGVRLVDAGNLVHASDATGIVIITQLDPIAVIFTLPQDDLPMLAAQMAKGELTVEAYARDGTSKLGQGKLQLLDNQINQATATLRLKAIFPNPTRMLWPNQFVKARLLLSTRSNALVVPATAVQRGPTGTFAYVIGADQTVSSRPIEVELTQGDSAIIARGLADGEQVVVDGQNQLRPGAKVQVRRPGASPDGKGPGKPAEGDKALGQGARAGREH